MDFFQAIVSGLKDSVNPCALTTMSLFILALLVLGKDRQIILDFGAFFLTTVFLVSLGVLLGWTDFFLGALKAQNILRLLQVVLGYALIILGIVHLYDWARRKISAGKQRDLIPYPLENGIRGNAVKILGIVSGLFLTLAQSIWPPDFGLAVLFYNVYLPGKYFTAFIGMAVYTLFLMLPLVFFFGLFYTGARNNLVNVILEKQTAMIKIVLAGFFVSLGIGLIQLFS